MDGSERGEHMRMLTGASVRAWTAPAGAGTGMEAPTESWQHHAGKRIPSVTETGLCRPL